VGYLIQFLFVCLWLAGGEVGRGSLSSPHSKINRFAFPLSSEKESVGCTAGHLPAPLVSHVEQVYPLASPPKSKYEGLYDEKGFPAKLIKVEGQRSKCQFTLCVQRSTIYSPLLNRFAKEVDRSEKSDPVLRFSSTGGFLSVPNPHTSVYFDKHEGFSPLKKKRNSSKGFSLHYILNSFWSIALSMRDLRGVHIAKPHWRRHKKTKKILFRKRGIDVGPYLFFRSVFLGPCIGLEMSGWLENYYGTSLLRATPHFQFKVYGGIELDVHF